MENKKIGKLTVLRKDIMTPRGHKWLCQCECGNLTPVREDNLRKGYLKQKGGTTSCGCINSVRNHCRGLKRVDRIGEITPNSYQYVLRLLPDSNRSYNYLYYDLTNNMWRTSDPRHIKSLAHSPRFEFKTPQKALKKYYAKVEASATRFSSYAEENELMTKLANNDFIWSKQYSFEDCKDKSPLPFDVAVFNDDFELACLIEYDGEQHFKETPGYFDYAKTHAHDLQKNKYCFEHDIPLIRIPHNANYTLEDLNPATSRFLLTPENEANYYK